MKRLIFVNRFFFPDYSATSQILTSLVSHMAADCREVHVITSNQLYDNPNAGLPAVEIVNGVHVHRISSTKFGRAGLLGRAMDYLSFYGSLLFSMLRIVKPQDVIIAETDPPLTSILAMWVANRRNALLVNWLQDIYPEVAVELGVKIFDGPLGRLLCLMRDRSLKQATANVVLGHHMEGRVLSRGVASDRVYNIPNWCDDESIQPIRHADNPMRHELGLDNKFVVGYAGNLGRAHEFNTILGAAERLREHPNIVFVFVGGGHYLSELADLTKKRGLERLFRFVPYQNPFENPAALNQALCLADVHWLSLRPELEGLIVPSKFYSIAAAGRATIAITDREGEIARLVEKFECGKVIEVNDSPALAETLSLLSANLNQCEKMGERARKMLDNNFSCRQALERWHDLFEEIDRYRKPK
jgi:glycosyltransferase involved in cell wall biosynthesis